ncbi:MOSC domain-containing protein [Streptomyces bambusae]|uniref:MOSC domain-containing protein n=1 Tax=Streptomyces bambusae TaxID=1550616 RepID=UPI001CFCC7A4|nr:MOSC N-terminal beta barrel domain-containing protein [Streptomyces bambusae]MCB5166717.1 MOSC domain-containing protein [Streptomyces bambusae]
MVNMHVQALHVHPVKSLGGTAPREAVVEPWGLSGDRRWALIAPDGAVLTQREQPRLALASALPLGGGGVALTAPGLAPLTVAVPRADGTVAVTLFGKKVEAVLADGTAHDWFSAYLGLPVRLVHLDAPEHRRPVDPEYALPGETVSLADGYPVMVATQASLDALNALIASGEHAAEGPLPMNRFRPNVVVAGAGAWAEDRWRRIAVGEAEFRVAKKCGRCIITTTDQATAERGREPLRTLGAYRRFGKQLVFGQHLVPVTLGTVRVGDEVRILE